MYWPAKSIRRATGPVVTCLNRSLPRTCPDAIDERPRPLPRPPPLSEGPIRRMVIFERRPSRDGPFQVGSEVDLLQPCLGRSPPPCLDVLAAIRFRTSGSLVRSGVDTLRRGEFERVATVLRCEDFGVIFFGLACQLRPLDRTLLDVSPLETCRLEIFSSEFRRSEWRRLKRS